MIKLEKCNLVITQIWPFILHPLPRSVGGYEGLPQSQFLRPQNVAQLESDTCKQMEKELRRPLHPKECQFPHLGQPWDKGAVWTIPSSASTNGSILAQQLLVVGCRQPFIQWCPKGHPATGPQFFLVWVWWPGPGGISIIFTGISDPA